MLVSVLLSVVEVYEPVGIVADEEHYVHLSVHCLNRVVSPVVVLDEVLEVGGKRYCRAVGSSDISFFQEFPGTVV